MKSLIRTLCLIPTALALLLGQEPVAEPHQERMTVYAAEDFRHRGDQPGPKLVYGQAFFLRFEPQTVGDILARIPGIAGTADAGEFDRAQMRGIAPGYTQVLINGQPLPGSADDRTLALDRIPADLVSRVEVSRAPDASMDASGIAGTINIILEETGAARGLDFLAALNHYEQDGDTSGQGSLTWHQPTQRGSWTLTGSVQDRHNPKKQLTDLLVFDAGDDDEDEDGDEKQAVGRSQLKDENNVLDSLEKALSSSFRGSLPGGELFSGTVLYLSSDRQERERAVFSEGGEVVETSFDEGDLKQESWRVSLSLVKPMARHTFEVEASSAGLHVNGDADIGIFEEGARLVEERETDDTQEREHRFASRLSFEGKPNHRLELGVSFRRKNRDAEVRLFEMDADVLQELESGGVFTTDERQLNAYASDIWRFGVAHQLQMGVRYQYTALHLPGANRDETDHQFFPSLNYLIKRGENHRYRLSLARTTRRPDFSDLQPFPRRNQPYDEQVTLGNPNLHAETANGVDVGYEHRFAEHEGIFGINFFYRDIADLVETVRVEEDVFMVDNVGDGQVWGVELDLGLPLDRLSMPGVSFYTNISWQDSQLTDMGTGLKRAFNLQPNLVVNATWLHSFPSKGVSYGLNALHQGKAREVLLTEVGTIDVGDTLDAYLEKKLGKHWSLRLSGHNLTDSKRTVLLEEYDGLWFEGEPTATGFERERAGRRYQLTLRGKL